jgi:hypothetical protein
MCCHGSSARLTCDNQGAQTAVRQEIEPPGDPVRGRPSGGGEASQQAGDGMGHRAMGSCAVRACEANVKFQICRIGFCAMWFFAGARGRSRIAGRTPWRGRRSSELRGSSPWTAVALATALQSPGGPTVVLRPPFFGGRRIPAVSFSGESAN